MGKFKRLVGTSFLLILLFTGLTQAQQESIFPELTGQQLIDSLRANYKPAHVLSYDDARDVMFGEIDNYNDSVRCVYSGYTIYIDPNNDPSTDAYNKDMNTEHTWPQSLGAGDGNARSDLQHLFPCRAEVNSSRGNDPFADIDDSDTDKWWRNDYYLTSIPTSHIDEYSEKDNDGYFEPREDHKGNAARAIFYIYTMYKEQLDTTFFYIQKETLRRWHNQDPPDAREYEREDRIAPYQDGKKNPFILDTTLVRRAYFEESSDTTGGGGSGGGSSAQPGDIVITEIMQNPDAVYDSNGEWFEIYNNSDHDIDLNGWIIRDLDSDSHTITSSVIIKPGEYLVLGNNADANTNGGVNEAYQYSGFYLANGADEIQLLLPDGSTEIDRVQYDGGVNWPDPTGASMYFTGNASEDNDDGSKWAVSTLPWDGSAGDYGTPGYANIAAALDRSQGIVAQSIALHVFPNPFNPRTCIEFTLAQNAEISVEIYSLSGQKVRTLYRGMSVAGTHRMHWDGTNGQYQPVAGGIYFVRVHDGRRTAFRKLVLLK
jgi:hypothetical protein